MNSIEYVSAFLSIEHFQNFMLRILPSAAATEALTNGNECGWMALKSWAPQFDLLGISNDFLEFCRLPVFYSTFFIFAIFTTRSKSKTATLSIASINLTVRCTYSEIRKNSSPVALNSSLFGHGR